MKDKYWHIDAIDYLLFALSILGILLVILSHRAKNDVDNMITTTDTIFVKDTITNWQYDTMYLSRLDTIKLPVVDTINDTIIKLDSVLVQIPIYTTVYDTTIIDTNYKTDLRAVVSGFQCQMNSLYLSTEIIKQELKKAPKKWYQRFCPAIGVGLGTGGQIGIFGGIGYEL